ncbi:MAG: hypothetical protein ACLQLG_08895 [Thermoguttaceae bacterium]
MSQNDLDRYHAALHAMQTGVAFEMNHDPTPTNPKHLRTEVNAAMCDHAGLVKLLISLGVMTMDQYEAAMADEMQAEVKRYEARIAKRIGRPGISLG